MLTLGSLFDGIGGFPLSGMMHGIKPVWAAEIEPFPILVTTKRFPDMKHLGSVTDINGAEIEPVDICCFGSPCQDLSVAGAQKGIHEGARSSLFFEAVRIIKEMRAHDQLAGRTGQHVRPRFAVWENVPGAYSSNKGRDFRAVLQALCEVADPDVYVPFPQDGKWQKAGCIVGEGYSVAWRTYDAQYWGVPQRRKRIYLVADFGSERAGEILFKPHGLRGDTAESGEARQGAAEDAEGRAGGSGGVIGLYEPRSLMEENWARQDVKNTLRAEASKSSHVVVGSFLGGQGDKAGGVGYGEDISPTLRAAPSGSNQVPDVVYAIEGNVVDRASSKNGKGYCENVVPTMNTQDRHAVAFAAGFADGLGEKATGSMEYTENCTPTLRAGDVRAVVYDARGNGTGGGGADHDR